MATWFAAPSKGLPLPALFSHFEWWDLASVSTCYRITHPIWRKNLLHQPLFPGCTFAAQDHGDLREHLAAVVIPAIFMAGRFSSQMDPNGTVGLYGRLSQHDDSYLIVVFLFDFCWSVSLLTLFPQKYQTFDRQHSCRVLSTVGRKPVQSKFMKWPFSHL